MLYKQGVVVNVLLIVFHFIPYHSLSFSATSYYFHDYIAKLAV